ncbi:MAG TPA: FAD-dependent oxidoreductase [Saliniramus sp.]|nr:FAD-dependent oxidoreductase [Saliniramus sp.]
MADGTNTSASFDVVVIGGGVVGLSCALALQNRGHRVAVVDPGDPKRRASFGNAGVISRGSILPVAGPGLWRALPRYLRNADPSLRIRYGSLPALAPWLWQFVRRANTASVAAAAAALDPLVSRSLDAHLEFARDVGCEHLIKRNGWLRLYRTEAALAATKREYTILREHAVEVEMLSPSDIAEFEPALAPRFAGGAHFPQTGSVESPGELVACYEAAFSGRGGTLIRGVSEEVAQTESGVAVRMRERSIVGSQAIIAAGAWSGELARKLGYPIPLIAERGYHQHVRLAGNARLTRPVNDVAGGYVLAPMGDSVRILSGVELARPDDPRDYRQIERVCEDARETLPMVDELIDKPWCGSRPSTPDSLPVIGRAPRHDRITFAFGHGHIGLSTGPITGKIVSSIIDCQPLEVSTNPFSVMRFCR